MIGAGVSLAGGLGAARPLAQFCGMDKNISVLRDKPEAYHPKGMVAASAIKGESFAPKASLEELQNLYAMEEKYPELRSLKSLAEKRAYVVKRRDELNREIDALETELRSDPRFKRYDGLKYACEILREMEAWTEASLNIERPEGMSFRRLRKAVAEGRTVYLSGNVNDKAPAHEFEKEVFRFAEVLMIEHDWAGAFQGADVLNSPVKLPYDVSAFEFRVSGRTVIALATQFETDIVFSPAIECGEFWVLAGFVQPASDPLKDTDGWNKLFSLLGSQIRAACIALDAEIATSNVVREPYSSAHGRNSHQPLKPYHVISLVHRIARALPVASGVETGRRVRLHFRRGHWRHFEQHKTWIKWMLVGDPDLGFVDKHYKL